MRMRPRRLHGPRGLGRAVLALAATLAWAGCGSSGGGGGGSRDADAGDAAGDAADVQSDAPPDATPDVSPDVTPDVGPDVVEDTPPDTPADLVEEDAVVSPPSFQHIYEGHDTDPVGITDLMAVSLTDDRIYVSGLWKDSARVSFFVRGADSAVPWCLYDGFGWPTGVDEDPATGQIAVADMVYGLALVTPPAAPGDCGCDPGTTPAPCDIEWVDFGADDVVGVGGVAATDDGTLYVSSMLDATRSEAGQVAGNRVIWELVPDGDSWDISMVAEGPELGDTIGLDVTGTGSQILAADSDGALRILTFTLGAWSLVDTPLQQAPTGFPTDSARDPGYYYWVLQSPFAVPDGEAGGSVLRVTLDGTSSDAIGTGDLVWPGGIDSDGEEWVVVDRATGLWGYY